MRGGAAREAKWGEQLRDDPLREVPRDIAAAPSEWGPCSHCIRQIDGILRAPLPLLSILMPGLGEESRVMLRVTAIGIGKGMLKIDGLEITRAYWYLHSFAYILTLQRAITPGQ